MTIENELDTDNTIYLTRGSFKISLNDFYNIAKVYDDIAKSLIDGIINGTINIDNIKTFMNLDKNELDKNSTCAKFAQVQTEGAEGKL